MTSSFKWEPVEDLKAAGEIAARLLTLPWTGMRLLSLRQWQLLGVRQPIDLSETEDAYIAEVDVPGMRPADLNVSVLGSKLTISGECVEPEEDEAEEGPVYLYRERPTGEFSRTLPVPDDVDVDQITAKLGRGVLVLTMPKGTEAKETTVEVATQTSEGAG